MHSHLDIEINGKPLVLPDDFSISIEERNPLFYDTEMFSYPVAIPLDGNRSLVKNIDTPQADARPSELEFLPVRIIADGMPFKSGTVKMTEDEDIHTSMTLNVDASEVSFDDLIGDLECQDIPLKDRIQIGEKIGNVKVDVSYKYKVKVHYREGKKDEWEEFPFEDQEVVSGVFEPQALGFSYPGVCAVTNPATQVAQNAETNTYPNDIKVNVPVETQSFINVSDPYPEKPYCNARVAYLHHGLKDDGTTSDGLPEMDEIDGSTKEEHYPYWVLDAKRPQSGICFYVLYFLECLFTHLQVEYDLSALTDVEDFKHLCFFTTHCKYDTEIAHGSEQSPFFSAHSTGEGMTTVKMFAGLRNIVTRQVWRSYTEEEFNQNLFSTINSWLESRGCGGQFVLSYPKPKSVQDFIYTKNGVSERVVVGQDHVDSIVIEGTIREASVSANILSMFATSENFPEESVKTVLDSLENSFGIKFHYNYEQRKVTAYLLRDTFRNKDNTEPIDFLGIVNDMYKVTEKTTGVRMAYSSESDSKEQRKNVQKGVKNYDTDYDYIDYQEDRLVVDLTYNQIMNIPKSQQKENLLTYVDVTTGNTFRWKTSEDSLESGEYKISLFQVATFKGVEIGDCSERNADNIVEFISDFIPVPFSDVNYRISEMMIGSNVERSMTRDGNNYKVSHFNEEYEPLLCAYIDEDMEHEFVPQYINNALPSAFLDIYLTEQLKTIESYDPSQTDDGNSPLQSLDWGLAIAMMQGGGTDATVQNYDYNYDGFGNSRWRRVVGVYALTSDSMDMQGNTYDYNGDRPDDGGGERFSLKIRSYAPFVYYIDQSGKVRIDRDTSKAGQAVEGVPDKTWLLPCNEDVKDRQGNVIKKIRSRGLFDSFMSEYVYFILNRKKFKVEIQATVAELNDITNHWQHRYRINGMIGWIGKINYDISKSDGIKNAILEFYAM